MDSIPPGLKAEIEKAFDFRGHVTITLKTGGEVSGYLFNRQFDNPRLSRDNFVEIFPKEGGDRRLYDIRDIRSVALTGEDCAAGKSYEDYLQRKTPGPSSQPT